MRYSPEHLSVMARQAVSARDWATVRACAGEILKQDRRSPEGHFLAGLGEKAAQRPVAAQAAFARALELDAGRHDAAIELASQYARTHRGAEALDLLRRYEPHLGQSPHYLNLAGLAYSALGLHERAWPLYQRANELQPGVPQLQSNLAACGVYLGRIEESRELYRSLLQRAPTHQRNHYELSQLQQATDDTHIEQMKSILRTAALPPEKNIFLYYAIGKELEDLGRWQEAFSYYKMAGDAVDSIANYDVAVDIELIDRIIDVCDEGWLAQGPAEVPTEVSGKTPIFIVGLPRTGTTLTERIIASHSRVQSIGETQFVQRALRLVSGVQCEGDLSPAVIEAAARADIHLVANGYLNAVNYMLGDRPMFTEKLPENFLYLGFIAKAFPGARIVNVRRNPMDACFAMYKQSFFRFAYTLGGLGRYYLAHYRLLRHWQAVMGPRLIEVRYESLVADQEGETRRLLDELGLDFEQACLDFDRNLSAIATASSAQVREKIHSRSVNRWKHFAEQLQPLRDMLAGAGIPIE